MVPDTVAVSVEYQGFYGSDDSTVLTDSSLGEDDDEDWDALDQEDVEAINDITSAFNVESLNDIDLERYPRFVIRDFGKIPKGQRVDALLKSMLPCAKIVYETQEKERESARLAAELREKRENLKKKRKDQEVEDTMRLGYEEYRPNQYY